MSNQKNKDIQFYLKELASEECICGKPKQPGKSFCYRCFKSLPRDIQRGLYSHVMDRYGEFYDRAVKWLEG